MSITALVFVWRNGGSLDLNGLVDSADNLPDNLREQMHFHALADENDEPGAPNIVPGGVYSFGKRPKLLFPTINLLVICFGSQHSVLDGMWIVVNSPETESQFRTWCTSNASNAWAATLPRPFDRICLSTNTVSCEITPVDPEPGAPNEWCPPVRHSTFLHHDAVYEMRTETGIAGNHGHQATYDANGVLIRDSIAAGTADFCRPYARILWSTSTFPNGYEHRDADVLPFIMALQLDGNPVVPTDIWHNLNRPCLYMGSNTEAYIARRPILPSGVQPLVP